MTTMAALLGALPLMLGTGTGSELRRPLGIAIVGGLIVSQLLTCSPRRSSIWTSTGWRCGSPAPIRREPLAPANASRAE